MCDDFPLCAFIGCPLYPCEQVLEAMHLPEDDEIDQCDEQMD